LKNYKDVQLIYILMIPTHKKNPILKILSKSLLDLPAPINISLWWNYGSLLGLFLFIQITTGIFLSIHYTPNTELAFTSLIHITRNVNWGWLLHNLHINGASLFILCLYIHIGRGIYYSSYYLKETWNVGVTIFIISIITAFIGYVLPWGQIRFWGATVITNIFSAIPYLGVQIVEWLWGGFAVANPTLNRFFIIHFILPLIILFMVILHLILLHSTGSSNPLGINSNMNRIPFHVYFTIKDLIGFTVILLIFTIITIYTPNYLSDPENFIEANPLITPNHIQPEWYFLWLYAILRSVPNKLGGVLALLLAIFILYLPPLTINYKISRSFYPLTQLIFFIILISWTILRWIGKCPVEAPYIHIGQVFRTTYFLYFIITPYINIIWNNLINK